MPHRPATFTTAVTFGLVLLLARAADAGSFAKRPARPSTTQPASSQDLRAQAARIVAAVTVAAEENARLPRQRRGATENRSDRLDTDSRRFRLEGDALADFYVRRAARAALAQRGGEPARAFVVALGLSLDSSNTVARNPAVRLLLRPVESRQQQRARKRVLGRPTVRGRHDLLLHFVVSASLTGLAGDATAEAVGLQKELSDARGKERGQGSGFSFADLAADYAGSELAKVLLGDRKNAKGMLDWMAAEFRTDDFVPEVSEFEEGLGSTALTEKYGEPSDPRFTEAMQEMRSVIRAAPGWHHLRDATNVKPRPTQ